MGGTSFFLARRYLRGRRSRLLGGTARAALGSSALGVCAMVVALSLMNGYTETLVEKMMQGGALIIAPTFSEVHAPGAPGVEAILSVDGITDLRAAVQGQGTLTSSSTPEGVEVYLRGIEPGPGPLRASADQLAEIDGRPGVVLGQDLADLLGVSVGDPVDLVALDFGSLGRATSFRFDKLRVSDTIDTGFWLFDREYALLGLDLVRDLTDAPVFWEVEIRSPGELARIQREVETILGSHYLVRDWQRFNPELFTALELQKWGLFLLLGLIVVVSTFSVVSTLVVLVRERARELGVLTALGARPRTLRRVFIQCGLILGATGTALGLLAGVALCWILSKLEVLRFDAGMSEIYFIDRVPFLVRPLDLLAVAAFSLLIVLLAARIPAGRAARLRPADALRTE